MLGLVDKRGPNEWYTEAGFDAVVPVEELPIPNFSRMVATYSLVELNTAVKPYFFSYFFTAYPGQDQIIYFDPDIQIFAPLTDLSETFENSSILLVPHFSTPHSDQSGIITPERRILQRGLYNLGFLGLKRSPDSAGLLEWWQVRLQQHCQISPEKGLFVDQKWMDLAPLYFGHPAILKKQGYDVAYWNLYENPLRYKGMQLFAGESPLRFYHFSAFDKRSPEYIDNLANKFEPEMGRIIHEIYANHLELLKEKGLNDFQSLPCAYQQKQSSLRKQTRAIKNVLKKWLVS